MDAALRSRWLVDSPQAIGIDLHCSSRSVMLRAKTLGLRTLDSIAKELDIPIGKFMHDKFGPPVAERAGAEHPWSEGRRGWTAEEDELIRTLWGTMPVMHIAATLRRSRRTLANRAAHLGLPSASEEMRGEARAPKLKPCRPTNHRPGTPDKIEILRQRIAAKQDLWHEDDPVIQYAAPPRIVPVFDVEVSEDVEIEE